jgi:hypothetical protein
MEMAKEFETQISHSEPLGHTDFFINISVIVILITIILSVGQDFFFLKFPIGHVCFCVEN